MLDLNIPEITELLPHLTEDERAELYAILAEDIANVMWRPLPGPQSMAYHSEADVLGYGGAAGGGKTDLMLGKAINKHKISYILRREATQMQGIYNRMAEIMGGTDGFNRSDKIWRLPDGRMIRFGSTPNLGDEMNYQGQARDFLGIDEAANFLRDMVVFLQGWVRTTDPEQQTQTLHTFNPPTNAEGRWVVEYYAPWLDEKHPNPALPGDIRWFATIDGQEAELEQGGDFYHGKELIIPHSRTFVPSRIADNPFLVRTNYMSTLQALPEPLRSQMLYGDFRAGMTDDPWQVIPTKWVEIAQDRWKARLPKPRMCSLGVDVARGGDDNTIISRLSDDMWFDELLEYTGKETPDGPTVAAYSIAANHDHAPIHIDVIGVGASPYDFLREARQQVLGINVSEKSVGTDRSGRLSFLNLRSELWWRFRELLDPSANNGIAIPPGRDILVELTAPKWTLRGSTIYVESREEIHKRIGRSPDRASAMILAAIRTPRAEIGRKGYQAGNEAATGRRNYNPYASR
jgi:hypothetical protein